MKEILITELRDKNTSMAKFRQATHHIGNLLAIEAANLLEKETFSVHTPLKHAPGFRMKNSQVLVPVLRAGLSLLPAFLNFFPDAKVGLLGLRRDESTAIPHLYYANLPQISAEDDVLILEPMLATGNTISMVMDVLIKDIGVKPNKIMLCSIVAAPEGLNKIKTYVPQAKIIALQLDESLNDKKFIVPGLGDFGDRYFGTVHETFS